MHTARENRIQSLLTTREKEIVNLIAAEYCTREIANKLFLSFETIKSHRRSIMQKLKVSNVAGIVREAYFRKLLYQQPQTTFKLRI